MLSLEGISDIDMICIFGKFFLTTKKKLSN